MTEPLGLDSAPVGPIPREAFATLTGVEILQKLMEGGLPTPPFAATTHIFPTHVEKGFVVFEGDPLQKFMNPLGSTHGGWIATLLDSAMGCAVHSMLGVGQSYTTAEMKVSYFKPIAADSARVRCEGRVLNLGSRIAVAEGKLFDAKGRLCAHGTETCVLLTPSP